MATLANLIVTINADVSKFAQGVGGMQSTLDKAGKAASTAGRSMTAGFTLPLVGAAAAALKLGTDMNASMANVATLIPGNVERVEELKTTVQEMAIATGKATGDLAGGLYQVISAFGDTADTATVLEINAKAAAAGLATTTDAIDLTSAVTKGYGDTSAAAVQQVSDLAFQTVKLGKTTFPELAASIGLVTPLAAELGVAQEELFGVMATGTGVTGTASQVSTQLRGVLQSLMAPTETMSDLYEGLGFASGKAMLEQLGLQGTIETLVKAAEETGTPLQKYIGSIEGQTLALALAGPQADVFSEKLAAMTQAAGATEEAFREQTQGINATGFELAQAQQKAAVMAQELGDALAPALSKALDAATPLIAAVQRAVEWFTSLDQSTQQTIITIAALVAAIGPVLVVVGTVIGAVGNLIGVVKALGVALQFLSANPVGLVITAIAALIAIGVLVYKNWDAIKAKAIEVWGYISGFLDTEIGKILAIMAGPIGWVLLMITHWDELKAATVATWEAIVTALGTARDGIMRVLTGLWESFTKWWKNLFDWLVGRSIVPDMVDAVVAVFAGLPARALEAIGGLWDRFKNFFGDLASGALDWGKNIMGQFLDGIKGRFESIRSTVTDFASGISGRVSEIASGVKQRIADIGASVSSAASSIGSQVSNIVSSAQQRLSDAQDAASRAVSIAADAAKSVAESAKNVAAAAAQSVGSAISGAGGSVRDMLGFGQGGMVPGPIGAPMLAMVHGGERVQTPAQQRSNGGGDTTIQVIVQGPVYGVLDFESKVTQTVRDAIRGGGFRGVIATP